MSLSKHDCGALTVIIGLQFVYDVSVVPGDAVRHNDHKSSYGVVVAVDDCIATVLWSKEPRGIDDMSKFMAMTAALVAQRDYGDIAKKLIQVEPMPLGAKACFAYDKDDDE